MCEACGCATTEEHPAIIEPIAVAGDQARMIEVRVVESLLSGNAAVADHNRRHFDAHGVLCLNLMSSPGAGKTALIEATIKRLASRVRIAVVEGDLATENDARRIRAHGVPAIQITTGNACHLDPSMVHAALHDLDLAAIDLLFIENVGNLVCPAAFDLGQHYNIVLLSATEGDDKPEKYPVMFRAADLVLLTKRDLLPYLGDFDPARAEASLRTLASNAPVLAVSARAVGGIDTWLAWLDEQLVRRTEGGHDGLAPLSGDHHHHHQHAGHP